MQRQKSDAFAGWRAVQRRGQRDKVVRRNLRRLKHAYLRRGMQALTDAMRRSEAKAAAAVRRKLLGTLSNWQQSKLRDGWQCWHRIVRYALRSGADRQQAALRKMSARIRTLEQSAMASCREIQRLRTECAEHVHRSGRAAEEAATHMAKASRIAERERRARAVLEQQQQKLQGGAALTTSRSPEAAPLGLRHSEQPHIEVV